MTAKKTKNNFVSMGLLPDTCRLKSTSVPSPEWEPAKNFRIVTLNFDLIANSSETREFDK